MRTLILLLLLLPLATDAARGQERPNLVLFMVDDLGWQDVSVPFHDEATAFNARYHTPNLERLAARGVTFTQAYAAAPVCTPSRTSWMTGRSPGQTRITYWTLHRDKDQSAKFPGVRAPAWNVNALQEGDVTLPRLLRAAGYATLHAGKAHFGARGTSGADPLRLGFEVNIAGHAAGGPGSYYGTENFSAKGRRGSDVWDVPGLEAYHGEEIFLTEAITRETVAALEAVVASERPFFLNFAPYAVHAPIQPNRRHLGRYEALDAREAAYATMIEGVDVALGALVETLEGLDVLDETVIVFTSDNGGLSAHARGGAPHTHNAPLRSGKGSAYEGGVRVPCVVALPGGARAGERDATPLISHDLFPTLLGLAGVAVPEDHQSSVEGVDLGPILRGKAALAERSLHWNQPHFWGVRGPGIWPYSAVRRGPWKLIYRHADRAFELYDLSRDLGEAVDLAPYEPEQVLRLATDLGEWIERVDAQLSLDVESGEPIEGPREAAARRVRPASRR